MKVLNILSEYTEVKEFWNYYHSVNFILWERIRLIK